MILALDPSLCCTGWVLAPAKDSPVGELLCGAITTEPAGKKQRLYVAEDDAQRAIKLCKALLDLKIRDPSCVVVSEQPAGSRHARSASALKLVQGALVGLRYPEALILWVTAADVKVALYGKRTASKDQMVTAATKMGLRMIGNKAECEAQADALGVLLASGLWRPAYVTVPVDATKMRVSGFTPGPNAKGRDLKMIQVYEDPWPWGKQPLAGYDSTTAENWRLIQQQPPPAAPSSPPACDAPESQEPP